MIAVDASAVVTALVTVGQLGVAARSVLTEHPLAYPSLMPFEAANALRRLTNAGTIDSQRAQQAMQRLTEIRGMELGFNSLARRVWELRGQVTVYDASYVAVAEFVDVPLLTLDDRLRRAKGPRCRFFDL
jgi:predicted nucleic acid-binding protein